VIKKEIGSFLKYIKLSPIILFLILSYFLFWKIKNIQNNKELQSVLLNQDLPKLELEYVDAKFTLNSLLGKKAFIINFFASWCAPCREEHAVLEKYSKDQIIIGIAYKDDISSVKKFLSELGDPYDILMLDQNGRAAIDLGLYGVPETYFIDSKGKIKYRQVGPLTVKKFENILKSLKVN
jgi:cytochrome c biogenesis protein CcmG/thiol:disulfide interchange protein DsbE